MPVKLNPQLSPSQQGFSMIELLVALMILLIVSSTVMSGLMQMSYTQGTITNRTEMHSSVRSATELMQQEIGQAGRFAIPTTYTLAAAVAAGTYGSSSTVALTTSTSGSFPGLYDYSSYTSPLHNNNNYEQLVIGTGSDQETVAVTAYSSSTHSITAIFNNVPSTNPLTTPVHAIGAPVNILGVFASGVVPTPSTSPTAVTDGATVNATTASAVSTCGTVTGPCGSSSTVLKVYGDINGDGNMVYVEYTCDTTAGKLYRNSMAASATTKPALDDTMVLLSNIQPNPGNTACFTYQQQTVGQQTYVTNIAVTLTVQTQNPDPKTHQYQTETKALLNVSPRNIFEGWQLASLDDTGRVQPMPPNVLCLTQATPGTANACPGT
jgi:prepilin-type N-terminal cleavage/methylation domain-containing protein